MDADEVGAIDVLLVDDDEEWLEVAGRSLREADGRLTVLTATGGREALAVLEGESVDCVVCDYRMPDMDGIELLERVRSTDEDLPFVLVTGAGSETVASRAISSSVTDYFVKDPGRDQSGTLAARIRSAVATRRTEAALATARRRFTGLFENVPSPVVIVDGEGVIYRVNDAFERTFGVRESNVAGLPVESPLDADLEGPPVDDGTTLSTLTLSTTGGDRDFLVRGFSLGAGTDEAGYVFTDVTDHRDRQRDLQRALDLHAEVRELFLSASSRESLERSFCETVVAREWRVGAVVAELAPDGAVDVRASAGETPTLPDDSDDAGDPLMRALRERSPVSVPDRDAAPAGWAGRAAAAGVEAALAVPIDRDGVADGAFAVYADEPAPFEGDRRERLAELVSSLGDAVALVERVGALAAERVMRVRLSVTASDPLARAAGAADEDLAVTTVRRAGDQASSYVDVSEENRDDVAESLAADDRVESVETIGESGPARLAVETAGPTLPDVVVDHGAAVESLRVTPDGYEATVDLPPSGDVESVVDAITDRFERTTVHSIQCHERDDVDGGGAAHLATLTEKQREALRTAYVEGYFERPRNRSAEEIAGTLDISGSTFLQHLRAAQGKLLASVFGGESSPRDAR